MDNYGFAKSRDDDFSVERSMVDRVFSAYKESGYEANDRRKRRGRRKREEEEGIR